MIARLSRSLLIAQALWQLLRYDVVLRAGGFRRIHRDLGRRRPKPAGGAPSREARICEAMRWALSLYCKPALCLQRAVATARLLRRHGMEAHVVIGYRPEPFFGHAWVEIEGRVVDDSPAWQRLHVLERI
ncbi:MAG: lasso peptide biosynthesis B2 protein [Acidobacteriia bacterium]|nr:lasso peptide biosynthesis B2 protein [Terriglobia bacterium]